MTPTKVIKANNSMEIYIERLGMCVCAHACASVCTDPFSISSKNKATKVGNEICGKNNLRNSHT